MIILKSNKLLFEGLFLECHLRLIWLNMEKDYRKAISPNLLNPHHILILFPFFPLSEKIFCSRMSYPVLNMRFPPTSLRKGTFRVLIFQFFYTHNKLLPRSLALFCLIPKNKLIIHPPVRSSRNRSLIFLSCEFFFFWGGGCQISQVLVDVHCPLRM